MSQQDMLNRNLIQDLITNEDFTTLEVLRRFQPRRRRGWRGLGRWCWCKESEASSGQTPSTRTQARPTKPKFRLNNKTKDSLIY